MRVVPSTRTKDDANKELHEIELAINVEKAKLESIARQRAESEAGFAAREQKCKEHEEANARIEKKFNSVAGNADIYLENINKETQVKKKELIYISEKIEKIHKDTDILRDAKNETIKTLDKKIEEKELSFSIIDKKVSEGSIELKNIEKNKEDTIKEIDEVEKQHEKHYESLSRREIKVAQREIDAEKLKSELRVWAVRLHTKYKDVITEVEDKILSGYIE